MHFQVLVLIRTRLTRHQIAGAEQVDDLVAKRRARPDRAERIPAVRRQPGFSASSRRAVASAASSPSRLPAGISHIQAPMIGRN